MKPKAATQQAVRTEEETEEDEQTEEETLDATIRQPKRKLLLRKKMAKPKPPNIRAAAAGAAGRPPRRRRSPTESWSTYLHKVLRQVHPDMGISRRSMSVMNSIMNDMFERIAGEAGRLCRYNKKSTLSAREIQTAIRLILPREITKHAISHGSQATTLYFQSFAA